MKPGPRIELDWKTSHEIRRDGPDRCRVQGCKIPMAKDWGARSVDNGRLMEHAITCGNHEIDKVR